mgnify:CR=1 FL=1
MILTQENYYSKEANQEYLSVSQYKDFCGTIGRVGCEEQALAKLNGDWEMEKTTALWILISRERLICLRLITQKYLQKKES